MSRLIIRHAELVKIDPVAPAIQIGDSTTHIVAAAICSVWGCVLLSAAFWLWKEGSNGMGAALVCFAYSAGYFWFARITYRSRKEGRRAR